MPSHLRKHARTVVTGSAIAVGLAMTALAGPIWDCIDPEGNEGTPGTSETPSGSGELAAIRCSLSLAAAADGGSNPQHMYRVRIVDVEKFLAITVEPSDSPGFNTQIFLFDQLGRGILANTNADGQFSGFGSQSNDGSGSELLTPGIYFIAISGGEAFGPGRYPVDQFGNPIFNFDPNQPELVYGPATNNPIAGWLGAGEVGDYEFNFIAVHFIEESFLGVPTVSEWGLIVFALLLLCAGTLVIRQRQYQLRRAAQAAV
jgi:hypothetical protein